jgi:uncharacterized LabA/DUF88 family protein
MPTPVFAQKTLFLFDGPNFYKNLKSAKIDRGHLNYHKLAENLAMGRSIVEVMFFTSPVDRITDTVNYQKQQKFFESLKKTGVTLRTGNLVTRNIACRNCKANPIVCKICNTPLIVKNEKSVDVQITMEMLIRCMNNDYDILYLASCDSDLVPAIQFVRKTGKQVFLLLPHGAKGYAVSEVCNITIPINQDKINLAQNY